MYAPQLIQATIADYPIIQSMARFYAYDMSRDCGQHLEGWEFPENGLYECSDFKKYFEAKGRHPFLIKINNELAGFVLINKLEAIPEADWNMGEFFIVAKFQKSGIGRKIAKQIFDQFSGEWSVGAIPENTRTLNFWRKIITEYTDGEFSEIEKTSEELRTPEYPDPYPMIIFRFKSCSTKNGFATNTTNNIEAIPNNNYEIYGDIEDAYDLIGAEILSYNKHCVPGTQKPEFIYKNYIIKKENKVIAGICADIYIWKIIFIDLLFVQESHRSEKLGTILLRKVEAEAKAFGVKLAHLDTFDFQAKDFYLKHGYEVFGILEDCPQGHKRYYLKKNL